VQLNKIATETFSLLPEMYKELSQSDVRGLEGLFGAVCGFGWKSL
jgi:hypothetical protein